MDGPSPHRSRGRNTDISSRIPLSETGMVDTRALFFTAPAVHLLERDASDTHFFSPCP